MGDNSDTSSLEVPAGQSLLYPAIASVCITLERETVNLVSFRDSMRLASCVYFLSINGIF